MKILTYFAVITFFLSCKNIKNEEIKKDSININNNKMYLSESYSKIDYYKEKAKKEFENANSKQGMKYLKDSVKATILGSYIDDYNFQKLNGQLYKTNEVNKPIFLQVTASWCLPCKAEIPALNEIVKKYNDRVDFVLLFWDSKESLSKFSKEYNERINLIPSPIREKGNRDINIDGFKHNLGYPYNYAISKNKEIVNFSGGAYSPDSTRTKEEVFRLNYEKLEKELTKLENFTK